MEILKLQFTQTHSLGGPFEMHKMHDFFVKNLLGQEPPEWE